MQQLKIVLVAFAIFVGVQIASSDGGDDDDDAGGRGGERFKIIKKCAEEFSISGDDAKAMVSGNFSTVTENIQCFVKCVMIENKALDEEQDFNPEAMIEKLVNIFTGEKPDERTQKCEAVTEDSSCSKAYSIFKCLREKRRKQ